MARQLRIEFPGACYHVMNRGNDRRKIFDRIEDYQLFTDKLAEFSETYDVDVRSYCLMPKRCGHTFVSRTRPLLLIGIDRYLCTKRAKPKSPVRENRTPGSVRGLSGNR